LGSQRRREDVDEREIVEAFKDASQGYSIDRVIADPVLNAAFIEECGKRGLSGRISDWNLTLLKLRKSSQLIHLGSAKRTQVSWESMDPFLFASEIALRRMLDLGFPSLDHVLCDPLAVAKFDEYARHLAPGFSRFEYRWAALRLRKKAKEEWRQHSSRVRSVVPAGAWRKVRLDECEIPQVGAKPGVYRLAQSADDAKPYYIGETWNLASRAERTLRGQQAFDQFMPNAGKWEFQWHELDGAEKNERRGLQSRLIGDSKPPMNYLELAAQVDE
jgi:site-specific DNA-methyltransferase (adenine-specific)